MAFGRRRTYLDWASAAPVAPGAMRAFARALEAHGNPSAAHAEARAAKVLLEKARTKIARLGGIKAEGVIYTSGATEANNIAIQGLAKQTHLASPNAPLHILYLPSAHASLVDAARSLAHWGIEAEPLMIEEGVVSLSSLTTQLRPDTFLVTMDAVCGETGTRWDTRGVRQVLDAHRKETGREVALHVDASQLPRTESFEMTRLAADLVTLDAQKVGGVRGIGALLKRPSLTLAPILFGGGQEGGLRSGTEPVALATAFAAALTHCAETRDAFAADAEAMRAKAIDILSAMIPDLVVNEGREGVPHILNISLPGRDTDYVVALMDEEGFALSTKSACETDSEEGSRAVLALTGDALRAASTVRLSWGATTSEADLRRAAEALIRTVRFLDTHSV